ncbi:TonB-dependent receptor [Flavobacterium dauae]|uniref:TonB-dependent receptor plug domain-containing protein n=1 Tax=Flavobacterium dauae TaxID=1563479 RepID=UPI00101B424D|nr:TonB-dependent receptor [Flavobacterium dauae]WLD24147.1 TonB-dependent receptor [Flavobacterium dauae]
MKYTLLVVCVLAMHTLYAQDTYKGKILNTYNQSIEDAKISVNDSVVATTDKFGMFEVTLNEPNVVYVYAEGYEVLEAELTDKDQFYTFQIQPEASLNELVVNVNKKNTERNKGITNSQTMNSGELLKAACCNLAESFETNPSIDVNFSDAISGSKQIKMLGLTSPYILIAEENIPSVRGASQAYGLSFTPGTWVESIQVTKGAGSVVNGFESISGQINTELIKPANDIPFYLNLYGSTDARFEMNAHFNEKISDKWSSSLFLHGNTRVKKNDMNHDGFLDNPLGSQINIMNRWQYQNLEKGWIAFLTARYMKDEKQTGEVDFDKNIHKLTTDKWGSELNTDKFDVSSKVGYVFPDQPYKSFGWQNSFSYHKQNSYFGLNQFDITQRSIYSNLLYSSIISNTLHKFSTGASFMYDDYSEFVYNYTAQNYDRTDTSYGAFFEYTYDNANNLALILGGRIDNSNRLGTFVTPRMHLRYTPFEKTTVRASAGRGKRLANIFAENQYLFASSREFNIKNDGGKAYGMDPEIAWNYGVSISQDFTFLGKNASLTLDFYRTDFQNQIVVDLDQSARSVNFYNLDGKSYANSFQAELNYNIIKHLNLRTAYKYYDIKTTYNGNNLERPLQAKHRLFANLEFMTHEHNGSYWKFDATWNWLGKQRLPYTGDNSQENQLPAYTSSFSTINAQVTKVFSDTFEVYVGGENIGNYQQHRVILGADDPFGNEFDSTIVYGPIFGQMYYAGLRFKIK